MILPSTKAYERGVDDYAAGKQPIENPFVSRIMKAGWYAGYHAARYADLIDERNEADEQGLCHD